MIRHSEITNTEFRSRIRHKHIRLGGNRKLKIYGTLRCTSGKRMKRKNRIFFSSEEEAIKSGYRPCGYCMKEEFRQWKNARHCLYANVSGKQEILV